MKPPEAPSYFPALSARSRIVAVLSGALGLVSFVSLQLNQDTLTAFQFSMGLTILGIVCGRWWTNPVHPGIFNYFSPYTAVLANCFVYYGPGNLPPLAHPEQIQITYGSQEYYPPVLIMALAGIIAFDLGYRYLVRLLRINESLERCLADFYSPRGQSLIAPIAFTWYSVCMGIIIYMSQKYLMSTLHFVGVGSDAGIETSFSQAGPALLGVAWGTTSLLFFRKSRRWFTIVAVAMLVLTLPIFLAYQQRRLFLFAFLASAVAFSLSQRGKVHLRKIFLAIVGAMASFILMSMAKAAVTRADPGVGRFTHEERNIFARAQRIITSPSFFSSQPLETLLQNNARERMAGLDWPAAIMDSHLNQGAPFLWGKTNLTSIGMTVPRLLWPGKPSIGIGAFIYSNFGLAAIDPLGTPLSSAYADGGIIGITLAFFWMAILFSCFLKVLLLRPDGLIIYVGILPLLLRFEDTASRYPIRWIRWILIMIVVNTAISYVHNIYAIRRHEDRH